MNRPVEFKKELIELLKKYDAQLEVKEPDNYTDSPYIEVFFNSLWINEGRVNVDECYTLTIKTQLP